MGAGTGKGEIRGNQNALQHRMGAYNVQKLVRFF